MCSNGREPDGCGRQLTRLNFDVLRLICNDLTEVSDVLSFALTCSTLRKGALQRRLRMSPVVLRHPESIEALHRFIFADTTSRAPYLYGLVLSPDSDYAPKDDPRFIIYLVAILEAATHLEYLYFPTKLGHPVCTAVTKMTSLRELVIYSDSGSFTQRKPEALSSLITALRSPLQYLTIADHEMHQISASFLHNNLRHFAPTLQSLILEDFDFNISPSSVTTPFTAMRSLTLHCICQSDFYQLDVLLRLFPNLNDTLSLKGFMSTIDQYPTLRGQSQGAQRDYTWPGLDRVVYSARLAFLLALQCPIRCMDIDAPAHLHETPYLTEALRDSCPRQLLLPIIFPGHDDLQDLHGLFPPEATDKLTHLVMFAQIMIDLRRPPTGDECKCFSWAQFMVRRNGPSLTNTPLADVCHAPMIPGRPHRLREAPPSDAPPRRLPLLHLPARTGADGASDCRPR